MIENANIYVDQGVDFVTTLDLDDGSGNDFVVEDFEFFCQIRKVYSSHITANGELRVAFNGESQKLELMFSAELTRNIKPGKYQYDILMRNQAGKIQKILEGLCFINPTITIIET